MTPVLVNIVNPHRAYPDAGDASVRSRMLTVVEYRDLAERIVGRFAPRDIRGHMLRSEDAIDFVAHMIMRGDWSGSSADVVDSTRRGNNGKWAIQKYARRAAVANQSACESLEDAYDLIQDPHANDPSCLVSGYEEGMDRVGLLTRLLDRLSPIQKHCIVAHRLHGKTFREIAETLSVRRQIVERHIRKGMKVMSEAALS